MRSKISLIALMALALSGTSPAQLVISQYTETDTGTTPKGIEVWNPTANPITFDGSANKLDVKVGVNGAALATVVSVSSGTLAAGDVWVIGTSDMTPDTTFAFTFNGDDALSIELGGVVQDVFGNPGFDPGTTWASNGVGTANMNIQLLDGITNGTTVGWTDPSLRFSYVSTGSVLTGFGTAPGGAPVVTTNVKFTASSAAVSEASVSYTVTVVKTIADGNVSGELLLSGTATEGVSNDYTVSSTNFTMNGATTSATFVVTINNDTNTEVAETVILSITNVVGGTIVFPSSFTLTINDDDVALQAPEGIASFRFYSATAPYLQVTTNDTGISVSSMSLSAGSIGTNITTGTVFPNEPYVQGSGGWTAPDQATAKSFQFTITPDVGSAVTITAISFRAVSTPAGPSAIGYDIGGLATDAFNATNDTLIVVSQAVAGVVSQTTPILFKIQGWTNGTRATAGSGDFRLDDVLVFGVIAPAGETPPVLAAIGNKTVLTNTPISFAVTATPTDGDTVTLSVSNTLPSGATFGSTNENGTFEWLAPAPVGVYTMTFYAADNDGADSEQITITVTSSPTPPQPLNLNVWINELHYDNAGVDTNEGVEIAGPAGTDLSLYSVVWYNGGDGAPYLTNQLSGVIDNESNGFGALWFDFGTNVNQNQNGPNDGLALIYNSTGLIQFLSYEGTLLGVGGAANGATSTDIGVSESSSTLAGDSLQLCGNGTNYAAFSWTPESTNSAGSLNACQTIPGGGGDPNDIDADGMANDWETLYFGGSTNATATADDDGDGYPNLEEFIAQTIPVLPNGATSYFRTVSFALSGKTVGYPSVTGRLYRLWGLQNLVPGTNWTTVAGPQAGNGSSQTLVEGASTTSSFYRLTVEMAP